MTAAEPIIFDIPVTELEDVDEFAFAVLGMDREAVMEDFDDVCVMLALDEFEGFCYLDYPTVLGSITKEECERFLVEALTPERLAMGVVR